jgi:Tol biopolymer transport system component
MSPDGRFIAYVTTQSGDRHIWLYDVEEKNVGPLTANEGSDESPSFSPDNESIVFASRIGGQSDLWLITQREELTQLTNTEGMDEFSPSWSADGRFVYFVRTRGSGSFELCRLAPFREAAVEVLRIDSVDLDRPVPCPSTGLLYFQRREGERETLYAMNIHGGSGRRFTSGACGFLHPSVSPDGKHLAFVSNASGRFQVYITSADQFRPVRITEDSMEYAHPSWTADGKALLVSAATDWDIRVIDVDSQTDSVLVAGSGDETTPVPGPDGRFVLFIREGRLECLDMSSGRIVAMTDSRQMCSDPDLSPDGARVLFTSGPADRRELCLADFSAAGEPVTLENLRVLTAAGPGFQGRFDASGRRIVYVKEDGGQTDVWLFDMNTGTARPVTVDRRNENSPCFSTDGLSVFFCADWAGRWSIWQAPASGGIPLPVTRDKTPYAYDGAMQPSPDGQWLAFVRSWYDDADIWLMKMAGGEKTTRTLTKDNTRQEGSPRWMPDGRRVVYQAGRNVDCWRIDISKQID